MLRMDDMAWLNAPGGPSAQPSIRLAAHEPDVVAQLLAPAVDQLFKVTLALAAAATHSDDDTSCRLLEAIGQVDAAIWDLRCSLLRA